MSRPDLEEAQLLLHKAREDAEAVGKLAADIGIADAIVGFHALCGHPHKAFYADLGLMPT